VKERTRRRTNARQARRSVASESGSIIVLTALSMVIMLGILALAVDASFLFTERNRMAAAADAAAKAAAMEYQRSLQLPLPLTLGQLKTFAEREVTLNGFDPAGATTVTVARPPATGSFSGNQHYVEVRVSRPTNTFFARVINASFGTITPVARAVAGIAAPQYCFITRQNLNLGSATFQMNGCDAGIGGALTMGSGAGFTGTPVPSVLVSSSPDCGGPCPPNVKTVPVVPGDPFSSLDSPDALFLGTPCVPAATNPLESLHCYSSIPSSLNPVTLQSGPIKVTGAIDAGTFNGSDVLLYLTSTAHFTSTDLTLNLTGRSSGPYEGMAIYADAGVAFAPSSNLTLNVTGAVYMPGTDAAFSNLSIGGADCALMYFGSLNATSGSGTLSSSQCAGTANFLNAAFLGISLAE
jgi:hypothetical protein